MRVIVQVSPEAPMVELSSGQYERVWWCGKWGGIAFDGEGPTESGLYCTNETSLSREVRHLTSKHGCRYKLVLSVPGLDRA